MSPMNLELGMSSSEAQSNKVGPFTASQGDWIVSGSGAATAATATNWGLIAALAGLALVGVAALFLFTRGKR